MKLVRQTSRQEGATVVKSRCNHPVAVVIDPSDRELRELEAMLAKCPNCSLWTPGDGPIMAILSSEGNAGYHDPKEIL